MPRNVNCYCAPCNITREVICDADSTIRCPTCHTPMEQRWWERGRQRETVWAKAEWATVFRKPDGSYKFPGRADVPTPEGCERITIKSDREMAQVEQAAGVRSERRWFDRGSGSGFDTRDLPPVPDMTGITIKAR